MAEAVGALRVDLSANAAQFEKDMGRARKSVRTTTGKMSTGVAGFKASVGSATRQVFAFRNALLALGTVAAMGAVLRGFAKFESELAKIEGLVGIAGDAVDAMGKQILSLAPEVGRAPQELAEALFFITSAGLTGSDAMDALRASARAATAGLGETKTVADAVTSAMNAYATAGLSAEQATDVLVATVREGKLEAAELSSAIGQVLAVAENAGVRFDEVGASVAALTRVGIGTSEAVTGLRAVLSALTRESKEGTDILDGMGTSFEELRESIKERGLLATLVDLRKRIGGNDTALVKILGSVEAVNTALALTGANADQVSGIFDRMADSTGALDTAFNVVADTAQFQVDRAMAALNATMIAFGDALAENRGPLTWFADQMERLPGIISNTNFLLRNLSTTLQVLADQGLLPGLDIDFPLGPIAEYQKALGEVQRLESAIADEREKLAGMDPDIAARNEMAGPLPDLIEELEQAQRRLEDARQRYAADIRSSGVAPSRDLAHLRPPAVTAVTEDGGGDGVVTVTEEMERLAATIDRLATSTASAKFEATALAAGMSEQEIAIRKTLIGMGLMNQAGELNANLTEQQRAEVLIYVDALRGLAVVNEDIEATTKAAADAEAARQELIDRGVTVTDNMRTAQEIYNDRLEELNELLAAGTINQQTFSRAVKQAHDTLEDTGKETETTNDLVRDLGMTFTSAFEDAIVNGGKLSDVLRGLEQDLIRLVMRQLVMQPLLDAGTSFLGGLSFGGTGAPSGLGPGINRGYATGGMHSGGFRMVGERGPELESTGPARYFSAEKTRGMMTGGGGEVTVNVYAPPGSSVEQRETTGPGGRSIDIIIDELTARNIGTPGSRTGRAIRNTFAGVNPQLQGR